MSLIKSLRDRALGFRVAIMTEMHIVRSLSHYRDLYLAGDQNEVTIRMIRNLADAESSARDFERQEKELTNAADLITKLTESNDKLGAWMAAALDDPKVCEEMKGDISAWFEAWIEASHV